MILRTAFTIAGAVLTASVGYAALTVAAPDAAGKIEAIARDYGLGWTETACTSNPSGCLNNRFENLVMLEREVAHSTDAMRAELDRTTRLVTDQEELVAKNTMFLDQGRALYRDRQREMAQLGGVDGPVTFAGRDYPNLATFKAQLQLLFEEKAALQQSVSSARELRRQLQASLDKMMVEAGQIALAKRVIPAQLQLIRANKALGEFSANVGMIDNVIRGSEAGLTQSEQLIRTTRDMMTPATSEANGGASQEAFDSFLKN
jgi:hypothetical protein